MWKKKTTDKVSCKDLDYMRRGKPGGGGTAFRDPGFFVLLPHLRKRFGMRICGLSRDQSLQLGCAFGAVWHDPAVASAWAWAGQLGGLFAGKVAVFNDGQFTPAAVCRFKKKGAIFLGLGFD